jgi:signal transduction histidine kinase
LKCDPLEEIIAEVIAGGGGPVIASKEVPVGKSVFMVNASPVLEPAGDVMGAVAVLRDITALKKLDEAKSVFVSMVAHEVKSPLAAVENYLDVLRMGNAVADEEKKRAILDRCSLRISALRNMVSELIDLTAIQTGHFSIKRTVLDIREVVAEAIDACREKAEAKRQSIRLVESPSLERTRILADPHSLLIICTNLIDNAIKYTQDAGQIEIKLEENGLFIRLVVRDNGIGMSTEEQEHIFKEFYRAKNEYTLQVPGTGLGLSVVKKLVECHEGAISVQSTPGNGSLFTVSLPIMDKAR